MKNFDIENNVNASLVKGAVIYYKSEIFEVINMDKNSIIIANKNFDSIVISDDDWEPIELNEKWLNEFDLNTNREIVNTENSVIWEIRNTGKHFYTTIKHNYFSGENPVIPLKYVHDLQAWYYRLTKRELSYKL